MTREIRSKSRAGVIFIRDDSQTEAIYGEGLSQQEIAELLKDAIDDTVKTLQDNTEFPDFCLKTISDMMTRLSFGSKMLAFDESLDGDASSKDLLSDICSLCENIKGSAVLAEEESFEIVKELMFGIRDWFDAIVLKEEFVRAQNITESLLADIAIANAILEEV
jgi:hypothetical protein